MVKFQKCGKPNAQCYIFTLAGIEFFVSYQTIIAIRSKEGSYRLHNSWGPTTGRHMKEMGVHNFPIVDPTEMRHQIRKACVAMGTQMILIGSQAN